MARKSAAYGHAAWSQPVAIGATESVPAITLTLLTTGWNAVGKGVPLWSATPSTGVPVMVALTTPRGISMTIADTRSSERRSTELVLFVYTLECVYIVIFVLSPSESVY